ncbi:alpha-aminoadipic semialdehyde synthase [Pseudohyphozyma bogoriensis]|nr:alpha-aminoadipic semialdehyde synthase [Pseudohyphozyma bogoriensis]
MLRRLSRNFSSSASRTTTLARIGVKAEDQARVWERRAPLSPKSVQQLTSKGVVVNVESSDKRVFRDREYEKAGAKIVDRVTDEEIVLGIKEIKDALHPSSTACFFSHTHKGQAYNLPLLASLLASNARVVDWELLTDDHGARTTAFGQLAGVAGMADGLVGFGVKALAAKGVATPFLGLARPLMCRDQEELGRRLEEVGREVREWGVGRRLGPVTVAVLGKGRVGTGARWVLDKVGAKWVTVDEMRRVKESSEADSSTVYACQLAPEDYLSHVDGTTPFNREEYFKSPELYESHFDTKVAPWTTIMLNGAFWSEGCPRILTKDQLKDLKSAHPDALLSIIDVSCDFGGGLEFVTAATKIDDPVIQYDVFTDRFHRDASNLLSTQISSIEILPSELPLDASTHFSDSILPYVESLLKDPKSAGQDHLSKALRRATVVENGKLAKEHEGLYSLLDGVKGTPALKKKALVLGSGLVAGPAIKVLCSRSDVEVTIASNSLEAAKTLAEPYSSATAVFLDAGDKATLASLVKDHDVVLSLLPATLHVEVAKLCIDSNTSLVTASYTSPAMHELSAAAKSGDVVLLNELGLDPGIDHLSAMKMIEDARKGGNEIKSFISFCGGLPSPEDSNGLLGYKFSWSPRGVLTAALNDAKFRVNSKEVSIPGKDLLRSSFSNVPIIKGFNFEGVANRNSVGYLEEYGLPADLPTILRGTLRYPTFANTVDAFKRIGLLDQTVLSERLERWEDLTDVCLGLKSPKVQERTNALRSKAEVDGAALDTLIDTLESLSLIPSATPASTNSLPALPSTPQSPIDLLSTLLAHHLRYESGEKDAVILHHELGTVSPDGEDQLFTSTLVQYGVPNGDSAMATTVGVPIALGALLCLDGKIKSRGIVSPSSEEVWRPLLEELEAQGIQLVEKQQKGRGVLSVLEKSV